MNNAGAHLLGEVCRAILIEKDPSGGCVIRVGGRSYTSREITTRIIQKVNADAEAPFNLR